MVKKKNLLICPPQNFLEGTLNCLWPLGGFKHVREGDFNVEKNYSRFGRQKPRFVEFLYKALAFFYEQNGLGGGGKCFRAERNNTQSFLKSWLAQSEIVYAQVGLIGNQSAQPLKYSMSFFADTGPFYRRH